jgi:hypothetical protein
MPAPQSEEDSFAFSSAPPANSLLGRTESLFGRNGIPVRFGREFRATRWNHGTNWQARTAEPAEKPQIP